MEKKKRTSQREVGLEPVVEEVTLYVDKEEKEEKKKNFHFAKATVAVVKRVVVETVVVMMVVLEVVVVMVTALALVGVLALEPNP